MEWMVKVLSEMEPAISKEKAVFLKINPINNDNTLACVWIISESLQYIWAKRRAKEQPNVISMKAMLSATLQILYQTKTFHRHATNLTTILSTM